MPASDTISFSRGAPSLDIVDVDGLREAANRAFDNDPAGITGYGTAIGYPKLRQWIADKYGVATDNVIVTNGSMQADAFLFELLVKEGDTVVVEKPTYDRTLKMLGRYRHANIEMIDLEPDGIDIEQLRARLRDGLRPKLAHIIPNFQNPAGYSLSAEKRSQLLALAQEYDFYIFEDDPYGELRFVGESPPTMLSLDQHDRVIYASSFSKTVCPGVRVGYLVGPADIIKQVITWATDTYISPSMLSGATVYEFAASGAMARSVETVKKALAERVRVLAAALERELPEAKFVAPEGGYFMWVELPEGTNVDELFDAAAERGVQIVKGTDFLLEGGENTLRLAYSGVTADQIEEGVRRLADAYRAVAPSRA